MLKIKNISGSSQYFGLGFNHRGINLANNAEATLDPKSYDRFDEVKSKVHSYVDQGLLEVVSGDAEFVPVLAVSSDYDLTDEDNGRIIEVSSASSAGSVGVFVTDGLPDNFQCDVVAADATGTISIEKKAGGSAVVLSKGGTPAAPEIDTAWAAASVYRVQGSDNYRVIGDVV